MDCAAVPARQLKLRAVAVFLRREFGGAPLPSSYAHLGHMHVFWRGGIRNGNRFVNFVFLGDLARSRALCAKISVGNLPIENSAPRGHVIRFTDGGKPLAIHQPVNNAFSDFWRVG